MKLKPLGDRLIVRATGEEETTASGLVLPDTGKEKPARGEVVAVGTIGSEEATDRSAGLSVRTGDTVLYEKYGGTEIKVEGEDLLVLRAEDVLATIAARHSGPSERAREIVELRDGVAADIERLKHLSA